jgi:hypothetical protein
MNLRAAMTIGTPRARRSASEITKAAELSYGQHYCRPDFCGSFVAHELAEIGKTDRMVEYKQSS